MSSHYLIDLFYSTAPLTGASIIDVTHPANGQTLINGAFVVRLPDTAALIDPTTMEPLIPQNLGDLITRKYQGILSFFSGFSHVVFDDLLDTSGINLSASGTAGSFGQRGTIALNPGATLTSNVITLASGPLAAVLTWEVFNYVDSDPSADRYTRTYNELPTSSTYTTAQVSFDNGSTWVAATDLGIANIPTASVGTQFIVQITNTSPSRLHVGSWALVY